MSKKHNFSAGPSILPQSVFEKASKATVDLDGIGLSILEISHRSAEFIEIMAQAVAKVKEIAGLGDDYDVLFLQGGASLQFVMAPMNLASYGQKTAYVDTGSWSSKAFKEAKRLTEAEIVASSKAENYNYIPKDFSVAEDAAYLHITSNNTIFGTQFQEFPNTKIPLIADMSSDMFSRNIDFKKFDLIYAGAQKNLGPAGVTLVIVKKEALGRGGRDIPSYLDYAVHADKESMFNTPPVFSIYCVLKVLEWIQESGGLDAIDQKNIRKAQLLYNEIDNNPLFVPVAATEDRSKMNVTFTLSDEALKEKFDQILKESNISNLNGHRSVGGYRASIYNSMDIGSVEVLIEAMKALN